MIASLLCALLQATVAPTAPSADSGRRAAHTEAAHADARGDYSSEALRRLVAEAAVGNRRVPEALRAYRAHMESELALLVQRPEGEEGVVSVEQVASEVRWRRGGEFEQRVLGYRAQTAAPMPSALSFLPQSWAVPMLYGNRIALLFGVDSAAARRAERRRRRGEELVAVHPLAEDRDSVYRYAGGDTVVTLRGGGRAVPIVRVRVEPRRAVRARTIAFSGELELDAERRQLVRMRGRFQVVGGRRGLGERLRDGALIQAAAYVELVNAQVERDFWLPAYQRVEGVATAPMLGGGQSAFRVVSRFHDYAVTVAWDSAAPPAGGAVADGDTMVAHPHRLSFAGRDSVERYGAWERAIGDETAATRSADFTDVAPPAWRPRADPWVALRAERLSDVFHFNRVEGAYTGAALAAGVGAREPGLTLRGAAGWAWAEQTVRGRAGAELRRGRWSYGAVWGRTLDVTNDFGSPFDSTAALAALLGSQDDYDYVDRHVAVLSASRLFTPGAARRAVLRAEAGVVSDRAEERRVSRGLFPVSGGFRENRGVTPGRYGRAVLTLDYDPDVTAEFVRTGVGGRLRYTAAAGELDFRRLEGRFVARAAHGAVTYAARLDGGIVTSAAPPPQELFELGGTQHLAGYDYKEFAGDQALSGGLILMRALPLWRSPVRVHRLFYLPAPAPALAVSLESGWVGESNDAAREAVRRLGEREDPATGALVPISRPTDGARTSVELGVRFFGGSVGLGVARPIDHGAPWRGVVVLGQEP